MTWKPISVTLYDGRQVLSDSPEWQHECECRTVLAMPIEQRNEFMNTVLKHRGLQGLEDLKKRCYEAEPYFVLSLPSRQLRNEYADIVQRRFGIQARDVLQGKVRAIWQARCEAEAAQQSISEPTEEVSV